MLNTPGVEDALDKGPGYCRDCGIDYRANRFLRLLLVPALAYLDSCGLGLPHNGSRGRGGSAVPSKGEQVGSADTASLWL